MKRHLWDVSRTVLPHRHVFDFNQALMDFGATLCTARKPKCLICPMRTGCRAYPFNPENEQSPARDRPRSTLVVTAAIIERRRPLSRDAPPEGRAPRRPVGVSRRQVRARRVARGLPAAGVEEELGTDADVGAEIFAVTHDYPERSVELHSSRARS